MAAKPAKPSSKKAKQTSNASRCGHLIWLLVPGIALLAVIAAIVTPRPGDLLPPVQNVQQETEALQNIDHEMYTRINTAFQSLDGKDSLGGWLYMPKRSVEALPPVIIMAHGLGAQRDMGLHPYAEAFVWQGFAVLVFDYRGFGDSSGILRNWVVPRRHLEDWEAAIRHVQKLGEAYAVDSGRIVLWGTSYSGGHVLATAAKFSDLPAIKGVISQVPHLWGPIGSRLSIEQRGLIPSLRLLTAGILDLLSSKLGLWPPVYVRIAGLRGTVSFMALEPEELQKWQAKHPKTGFVGGWRNAMPARFVFDAPRYSPGENLTQVKAPVMLMSAMLDALCPHDVIHQAAQVLDVELVGYPVTHFGFYQKYADGGVWEDAVSRQLGFACEVTKLACPDIVVEDSSHGSATPEHHQAGGHQQHQGGQQWEQTQQRQGADADEYVDPDDDDDEEEEQ